MNEKQKGVRIQVQAFASQLLPAIIGVLSFMLLTRMVETNVLGQYLLYMAAVTLFEMIKSGGLQSALVMRLSGRTEAEQKQTIGSAYVLGGGISLLLSILLALVFFSNFFAKQTGIHVFCGWYAITGLLTLPLHIAEARAVARQDLRFLLLLRLSQSLLTVFVALFAWKYGGTIQSYATLHLCFIGLLMLGVVVAGKACITSIRHKLASEVKALFSLMKFTLATLATTNLLKSADTFLIGGLLGTGAVAAYAVPLKLTELFEIPLRSLSTTAFPQLAAAHNEGKKDAFRRFFMQYTAWIYVLYIPALTVAFIAAPLAVTILGGKAFAGTAMIFRVFCLYGLVLPLDRLTGISLDALQKPGKNFQKVLLMTTINIVGDVIAIKTTGSLEGVAFASVLNAATGALLGFYLLQKIAGFSFANMHRECIAHIRINTQKKWQQLIARPA